jgi:hypothetical protein
MADELRIGLSELLRKAMIEQDADYFLKEGVRALSHSGTRKYRSVCGSLRA